MYAELKTNGQEDGTSDVVGGIQITPFNMTEEMEEGHFDKDGMYIFEKDKGLIQDHWMDNIDWVKVKDTASHQGLKRSLADSDDESSAFNKTVTYQNIVAYLKPGETVAKALRRLGGTQNLSASQRLKLKKLKKLDNKSNSSSTDEEGRERMAQLTGLADSFVINGIMDIYEMTFEKIHYYLKQNARQQVKFDVPADIDDDDALDMFADNLDKEKDSSDGAAVVKSTTDSPNTDKAIVEDAIEMKEASTSAAAAATTSATESTSAATSTSPSDEVMWEYKWEDLETAAVHGPHTSSRMMSWADEGYFKEGAYCRKINATSSQFYSTRRIDFDLYI